MKNPFTTFSIRRKITYGFILLLVFMVGTIGLTYGVSSHIEEKVLRLELIDDLFGSILEMRRFEKNYFLYGEQSDYQEALVYNAKSASILLESREELRRIIIDAQLIQIVQALHDYENYFQQLAGLYQSGQRQSKKAANLREKIRGLGKELTDQAEESSHRERYAVRNLLRTVRRILVAAAVSLLFLSVGLATLLGQRVVNSLKLLERYAEKISSEDFEEIRATPLEEEVRSVLNAFNRMSRILRIRQSQLVQSEKLASLGTLLSGVAHELNNPLSNISTSAQILREELDRADPEFKKELIQQIEDQSDKARDIVRTLLEFSRATEYHPRPVALKKLFEDTVVLIRGQIPTDVSISLECPDELIVEVDKQKLQQVFLNLLKNGIDAVGQSGKLWITARLLGLKESAEELEIMIEDNGPGIPPETIKKIFDPFFSTKDVGHGSGLGLYIVHDIVARHGGRINVNSQMGQGTTFTIWLPRKQEGKNE
jgi:signal transduction histidine kinase